MSTAAAPDQPLVPDAAGVLTIPVSPDAPGNALDEASMSRASDALRSLRAGELDAGAVLLVGAGKNFCTGGDVSSFAAEPDRAATVARIADVLHELVRLLDATEVPVVAAVTGWAAGAGLSLVLAADVSVGGPRTRLRASYPAVGLSPDGGMSWRLPRAIGPARARAFVLCDEPVDGAEAHRLGLLTTFDDSDRVPETARAIAERLAAGPRDALAETKRLLGDSAGRSLSEQLDAERDSISRLAAHPDGVEGVDAFLAKRSPEFGRRD